MVIKKATTYILLVIFFASTLASCGVTSKKKRYIKRNYKEIKKSFPEAAISLVQDSIKVIFPNNLVFDIGSADVKPAFSDKLNRFSEILKKYTKTNLLITGYTDNSGSEETNIKLSNDRAIGVKNYLKEKKIKPARLFTWGLGEKNPIANNDSENGRARNRRVEFVVLYKSTQ